MNKSNITKEDLEDAMFRASYRNDNHDTPLEPGGPWNNLHRYFVFGVVIYVCIHIGLMKIGLM